MILSRWVHPSIRDHAAAVSRKGPGPNADVAETAGRAWTGSSGGQASLSQQFSVGLFDPVRDSVEAIVPHDIGPPGFAEPRGPLAIRENRLQMRGNGLGIAGGGNQPALSGLDNAAALADGRDDGRQSLGHVLQQGHGQRLHAAGHYANVGLFEQIGNVSAEPEELHTIGQAKLLSGPHQAADMIGHMVSHVTNAQPSQVGHVLPKNRRGAECGVMVLDRQDVPDLNHHMALGKTVRVLRSFHAVWNELAHVVRHAQEPLGPGLQGPGDSVIHVHPPQQDRIQELVTWKISDGPEMVVEGQHAAQPRETPQDGQNIGGGAPMAVRNGDVVTAEVAADPPNAARVDLRGQFAALP